MVGFGFWQTATTGGGGEDPPPTSSDPDNTPASALAAPDVVNVTSVAKNTTGSGDDTLTLPVPTAAEGDVFIVALTRRANVANASSPAELRALGDVTIDSDTRTFYWWGISRGVDDPANFVFTGLASTKAVAIALAFDPCTIDKWSLTSSASSGTNWAAPSLTPTQAATLVCHWADSLTTWTPPGSMTERADVQNSSGSASSMAMATESVAVGATGTRTGVSASSQLRATMGSTALTGETNPLSLDAHVGRNTRCHALEVNERLIYGYTDSFGNLMVYEDRVLWPVGSTPTSDDHNAPAVLAPSGKPPIVAWTRHNADALVRYKIGTTSEDFGSLGSVATLTAEHEASYTRLFHHGTDGLFLATRSGNKNWNFWTSANYGSTWSSVTRLLDFGIGARVYLDARQVGDVLNCVVHEHFSDGTGDQAVYFMRINLDTGAITDVEGNSLGNLDGTNLPLTPTDIPKAYEPTGSEKTQVHDVSVATEPEIVLSEWTTTTDSVYRYVRWDSGTSSWVSEELVAAGATWSSISGQQHLGGCCFPDGSAGGVVYVAREHDGDWLVGKWTLSGSTWTENRLGESVSAPLARPHCPTGQSTGPEVVWHRVFRQASNTDYRAALVTHT